NDGLPFLRGVDSHIVWLQPPTLTSVSLLGPIEEGGTLTLTFDDLLAASDATDSDGTITGFIITAVDAGSLQIDGANFDATENAYVHRDLSWPSGWTETGDVDAFTLVAVDDDGLSSTSPVQVMVNVTASPVPPAPPEEDEDEPVTGQPGAAVHLVNRS